MGLSERSDLYSPIAPVYRKLKMKIFFTIIFCAFALSACGDSKPENLNLQTSAANNSINKETLTVSSRSNNQPANVSNAAASPVPKSDTKTKWTQSGNPIDTSGFDADIKQAEAKLKSNPKDENLKKSLAQAYFKRGFALTEARQYAAALGDYRRALKYEPDHEESKKWIGEIVSIYESINRSYPQEGEEPPPIPFKKES